ncbi:PAS domain-containing protein, partial [Treponema sp. R8-4-B8]
MNKARRNDVLEYLAGLQKRGHQQYLVNKMQSLLTEEERLYITEHPRIPVAAEFNNYPISFYDTRANKWEGIFFDALDEITNLITGLVFDPINSPSTQTYELNAMLENGDAMILSELFRAKENEGHFLWAETPILTDNYAFITKSDFHNIDIGEVYFLRVALRKKSHYADLFKQMFPDHRNYTEYETQEEVWDALRSGEADTIFASRRRLIIYTNYREEAGFKLNLLFDHEFYSTLGFNKDAAVLKSIVDKAISLININNISNQWMNRTYDYRVKSVAAQRSWLIGMSIMIFFMLSLVSILFIRSRNAGRQLESMVKERTFDLSFETSKLRAVINSIPDALFCKDKNFRYVQCNKSYEELIGRREADILGMTNKDGGWFSSSDTDRINNTEQTVMDEERTISYEQKIASPSNGKLCFFETVKSPIIQDGIVTGLITIMRDISQRKALEREIAFQTTLLKTMIDSLPDAVFCKDLDFKYTLCNNYMADMFGKNADDVLGKNDQYVLDCSEKEAEIINEVDNRFIKEERRIAVEEWLYCADGVKRLFETVKSP